MRLLTLEERTRLLDLDVVEEAARLRALGTEPLDAMFLALDTTKHTAPASGVPAHSSPDESMPSNPGRGPF